MAEYVVVPARKLVHLSGGGRYALVIGLGGHGQVAVQILTALTGATVIATDIEPDAMKRAQGAAL